MTTEIPWWGWSILATLFVSQFFDFMEVPLLTLGVVFTAAGLVFICLLGWAFLKAVGQALQCPRT